MSVIHTRADIICIKYFLTQIANVSVSISISNSVPIVSVSVSVHVIILIALTIITSIVV